jgi:hypothetical protein
MSSSIHSDVQTLSYTSDMRILMENMQALNVNNRQDDLSLINSTKLKDKEKHSMIPVRHYTPQSYRSSQSQSLTTETSDVCNIHSIIEVYIFTFNLEYCRYS